MTCLKNPHYKSTTEFNNGNAQAVSVENTVNNPVILNLGTKVTDTGVSLDFNQTAINVDVSGTYRISADFNVSGVTAGTIYFAIAKNGSILPETVKAVAVGTTSINVISVETVRYLQATCTEDVTLTFIAYSDGDGASTVELSGNVIKLA